jgi:trehalose/maltose hydrolase-like predicted phosphorylase
MRRTVEYYDRRTAHGSTLSRVVHSWVLARIDRERSRQLFRTAVMSDLSDIQGGTTAEGIHLGAMAGTVDMLQRGYPGLEVDADGLRLDPVLPAELARLDSRITMHGHWVELSIYPDRVVINTETGAPETLRVSVGDASVSVAPGATEVIALG